jgi:S-sulfo-L-cysteine synthase (O-acetyl-L-serine-dependent)
MFAVSSKRVLPGFTLSLGTSLLFVCLILLLPLSALVDTVLDIHQQDAENTMRQLAVREGIFCGVSSGGAVAGALRIARENPGAVVVAIVCDRGDRYLSTGVFGEEHFSQGAGI